MSGGPDWGRRSGEVWLESPRARVDQSGAFSAAFCGENLPAREFIPIRTTPVAQARRQLAVVHYCATSRAGRALI